jgi:hypothetical protein
MMTLSRLNIFNNELEHFLLPVSLNHGQAFKKFGMGEMQIKRRKKNDSRGNGTTRLFIRRN